MPSHIPVKLSIAVPIGWTWNKFITTVDNLKKADNILYVNMNNTDFNPFPELTNEELDAIVNELPTPTPEAIALYQAKIEFMHSINKEVGIFRDVVIEKTSAEEYETANSGKYMDTTYGTGKF
jgi:hypothetical protein